MILVDKSSPYVFCFDQTELTYRKIENTDTQLLFPRPYSTETASGSPIFPICHNCFFVLRHFMAYRNKHHLQVTSHRIMNLNDLYVGLYSQFVHDQQANFERHKTHLGWDHQSFTGGDALNDTNLTNNPENWVEGPVYPPYLSSAD